MTAIRWAMAWALSVSALVLALMWALLPAAAQQGLANTPGRAGLLLAVAAGGAGVLLAGLWWLHRRTWQPADALLAQVQALGEWRFEPRQQPKVADWVPLARALNVVVEKVRQSLEERDAAVGDLRTQLARDELTHAASRQHFMWSLERQLQTRDVVGGVAIIRVNDLEGLNARLGRQRADELLIAVATTVRSALLAELPPNAFVLARLNGADFGLLLPDHALPALSTLLESLAGKLSRLSADGLTDHAVAAWVGGTGYQHAEPISQVLSRVDAQVVLALGHSAPVSVCPADAPLRFTQISQWRLVIETALDTGHLALTQTPVFTAQGRSDHQHAQLTLILPDGTRLPREEVMAAAIRCGRCADLDLKAAEIALNLLEAPGLTLSLEIQAQSLARPAFQRRLRELLNQQAARANRLTLELADMPDAAVLLRALSTLSQVVGSTGCGLGLREFGTGRNTLPLVAGHGLRHAKLSAALHLPSEQAANFVGLLRDWGQRSGILVITGLESPGLGQTAAPATCSSG